MITPPPLKFYIPSDHSFTNPAPGPPDSGRGAKTELGNLREDKTGTKTHAKYFITGVESQDVLGEVQNFYPGNVRVVKTLNLKHKSVPGSLHVM